MHTRQQLKNASTLKAYHSILKAAKRLLSKVEEEPLRYTLTRVERNRFTNQTILHEWISPLLYLRLDLLPSNDYAIHYGYLTSTTFGPFYHLTSAFIRTVYRRTMRGNTSINIEETVKNDYVVQECAEAYEYVEMQQKHHRFRLILYKTKQAKPIKRKLRRVA